MNTDGQHIDESIAGTIHTLYYEAVMGQNKSPSKSQEEILFNHISTAAHQAQQLLGGHPGQRVDLSDKGDMKHYIDLIENRLNSLSVFKEQYEEVDRIDKLFKKIRNLLFGAPLLHK